MELVGAAVVGHGAPTSRFERRPPACRTGTTQRRDRTDRPRAPCL